MKILSARQIKQADNYTIKHEPVTAINLMERASVAFCQELRRHIGKGTELVFYCGTGNNGGDGIAAARIMHKAGYDVKVFIVRHSDKISPEFAINEERIKKLQSVAIYDLTEKSTLRKLNKDTVIIDALLGTGLSRPLTAESFLGKLITFLNETKNRIIALDLPSGFFADKLTDSICIKADLTITFTSAKLCFFLPESYPFIKDWKVVDIGSGDYFTKELDCQYNYLTLGSAATLLSNKARTKFSHKGNFGHSLIVAGSKGKMGAAIFAAKACVYSGSGLTTAHVPGIGLNLIQSAVPESLASPDPDPELISEIPGIESYDVCAIGPGIGTASKTEAAFEQLLESTDLESKLVIDADALNLLGENKELLEMLPPYSVLTPHPKEFSRMAGKSSNSIERLELALKFSRQTNSYIVLKGAHTATVTPQGKVYFNTSGNPGLAKGGSGDVLTGIITGLIAQGWKGEEACLLGVYLHGLAADLAVKDLGMRSLSPLQLIDYIGKAFLAVENAV